MHNDFDGWWDYNDPSGTEAKFRQALSEQRTTANPGYIVELLTQIARTQGLQMKFDEAHATLDEADSGLTPAMDTARVRSLLERGRVFNSAGMAERSVPLFEESLARARAAGLDAYAVDAAHMLGIVARGDDSLRWNETAMSLAEASADPVAQKWLGALYNNTGWTYFDLKRYPDALRMFERDVAFRDQGSNKEAAGIARWSRAKVLRHLGRVDEALSSQKELLDWPELQGGENEGYTREEIAECLMALGRSGEAKPHFARAWELLRENIWLKRDEPERLARLERMSKE
jgi:tetratricopeptide (TPR) repeat protein